MNEVLVLDRIGDPDDGMFSCHTGTINGNRVKSIATFWEGRRGDGFIQSFLRKTGKSISEYDSVEAVLEEFFDYLRHANLEDLTSRG